MHMKLKTSASTAAVHVAFQPLSIELDDLQASYVEDIFIYIKKKLPFSVFSLTRLKLVMTLAHFLHEPRRIISPTFCRSVGDEIISLKPVVEY